MKHVIKRTLGLLLASLLLCAVAPLTASAAPGDVCEIVGGSTYATLDAAIGAVENGQTVRLLAGITLDDTFYIDRKRTFALDTNGKTLDFDGNSFIITNYESNVTINGCEKLVNLRSVSVNGSMANYGLPLYKTVFNGNLTLDGQFCVAGYAHAVINGNMTFPTADGAMGNLYSGSKLEIKGSVTANKLAPGDAFVGVTASEITIEGNLVTSGAAATMNGGKLTVNGNATANGICGAYFFAGGGSIFINGTFTANETKYAGFTGGSLDDCGYCAKTQVKSIVKYGGVNYRLYERNECPGALYVKADGAFIFGTTYESTFWNWVKFIVLFGWIWMWF